jgi:menaquinol-cytochrome c reductase iron-sulfur subunit
VEKSRRKFLKIVFYTIGGILTAGVVVPLAGLVIHPLMRETVYGTKDFINIGKLDDFPIGIPKKISITSTKMDAWKVFEEIVTGSVWVLRHEDNSLYAFSTNCPHLGCGIDWGQKENKFLCPCHGGVFDIDGKTIAGPSPRGLYAFEIKIENNNVLVNNKRAI